MSAAALTPAPDAGGAAAGPPSATGPAGPAPAVGPLPLRLLGHGLRAAIQDPAWLLMVAVMTFTLTWACLLLAAAIGDPSGSFLPAASIIALLVWGGGMVALTLAQGAAFVERRDEGIRSLRRRWLPVRRHSWWGLLAAGVLLVGWSVVSAVMLDLLDEWLRAVMGEILESRVLDVGPLGLFIAGYCTLLALFHRWYYRLPFSIAQALLASVTLGLTLTILWAVGALVALEISTWLEAWMEWLDLHIPGTFPYQLSAAAALGYSVVMVPYCLGWAVALVVTAALQWAALAAGQNLATLVPLRDRRRGAPRLGRDEADIFT